jgi:asparagine synthase (glutamine-hydrolysing)
VRGLIPDELIDRKKQGFGVPVYEWFFDRLGDFARVELGAFCAETDILDRTAVMQLLERRDGPRAWYLLNLALWWKQYIRSEAPAMALVGD